VEGEDGKGKKGWERGRGTVKEGRDRAREGREEKGKSRGNEWCSPASAPISASECSGEKFVRTTSYT